jgi:hypothetical protein
MITMDRKYEIMDNDLKATKSLLSELGKTVHDKNIYFGLNDDEQDYIFKTIIKLNMNPNLTIEEKEKRIKYLKSIIT